ncbi:hypothetical protein SeMB42_g02863 [Synchytrium endobioticum]|uniref:Uncharacterized protein n=1 Tax=Synchytrium endobioticum TaxID=286115 RepID=A0A507DBL9_9FUNG|nr:hypothetical protein SeMB42_g02863 [Synchytrium endobioticum]
MEQFTVTYKGYPSEPRSTTVDHSGTTYPITLLPNQARIQHTGSDVVIVPLESRIAIKRFPPFSCFRTAAAAGALVVFSPERYTSTFSSSMTKGMDFWSADSLPIYGPQVRLLDVTENAPRCNHRKKRRDFRSHEGGGVSCQHGTQKDIVLLRG